MAIVSGLILIVKYALSVKVLSYTVSFPLRACYPGEYFSTLSSEYQHVDIVAKHSMCSRFDVCMMVPVCFCACMNAHVMAQMGGYLSLGRI